MAWFGYDMLDYALFSENPTWGEVGVLPFVIVFRIVAAGWVVRGVLKLDARALFRVLLVAGICSFLALYGWYFMLMGPADGLVSLNNVPYLAAVGDLLYIGAGLVVGCALFLTCAGARLSNNHIQ